MTRRATEALLEYDYPGNVREMQNLIERGVVFAEDGDFIDAVHMFRRGEHVRGSQFCLAQGRLNAAKAPQQTPAPAVNGNGNGADPLENILGLGLPFPEIERRLYAGAMKAADGNVAAAARQLGLSRASLEYRLTKFGLLAGRD